MKTLQVTCIALAVTITYPFSQQESQIPKIIQSIESSRDETPAGGALEAKQASLEYDSSPCRFRKLYSSVSMM
jgi:hypothetical protein